MDEEAGEYSATEFHNRATEFAKRRRYDKAVEVCVDGLAKFEKDIDLLADTIKFSSESGKLDIARRYFEQLSELPRRTFNWRAYTFSLDYLMQNPVENELICRELISDYKRYLPMEEKAYVAENELETALGNHEKALAALEEVVLHSSIRAPQAGLRLSDYYMEIGDFEKAINTINYTMVASVESQPSINISYLAYIKVLAEDGLLHKKAASGETVTRDDIEIHRQRYELLVDRFPAIGRRFFSTINDRKNLLDFITVRE